MAPADVAHLTYLTGRLAYAPEVGPDLDVERLPFFAPARIPGQRTGSSPNGHQSRGGDRTGGPHISVVPADWNAAGTADPLTPAGLVFPRAGSAGPHFDVTWTSPDGTCSTVASATEADVAIFRARVGPGWTLATAPTY